MNEIEVSAFKIRMLEELEDLIMKIDRLSRFVANENAKEETTDIKWEEMQLNKMLEYRDILKHRILKFME